MTKFLIVSMYTIKQEGEAIKVKDDTEYPEWIWDLKLDKLPQYTYYDPKTKEYWECLKREGQIRFHRMLQVTPHPKMRVGQNEIDQQEWLQRLRSRALAAREYDPGWNPEDWQLNDLDKRIYLKPQQSGEEFFMDEYQCPLQQRTDLYKYKTRH